MEQQNKLMTKKVNFDVNGEVVELTGQMVKNFLVKGQGNVTEQEIIMFINLCKYQKLNPFINEAYLVKFGSQPAQIIVSKEAFMKRAENNEYFKGVKAGIIVERDNELVEIEGAIKLEKDKLIGAYATVYRSDRDEPVTVKISLDEFGKNQATWKQMPMNMIRKTAIVNALREAFPNSVGAMYTEEEIQSNNNDNKQVAETTASQIAQNVQEKQAMQTLDFNKTTPLTPNKDDYRTKEEYEEAMKPLKDMELKPVEATENMEANFEKVENDNVVNHENMSSQNQMEFGTYDDNEAPF